MGTGYKVNTDHHYSLSENLDSITSNYPIYNGYFGKKGDGSGDFVRHIESDDPLKTAMDFYDKIAKGGIVSELPNGKGTMVKMKDGTFVSFRVVSSSDGSPAVDINVKKSINNAGVKNQKIHFIKKGTH